MRVRVRVRSRSRSRSRVRSRDRVTVMHTMHWIVTLVKPLPSTVAPRKVQKGISSQPHAMPHMSKAALGHDARRRMPTD